MRLILLLWILFGLFIIINYPARAEFNFDKLTIKVDSTEGKEIEEDFYCYSDWRINNLKLEMTNKFSWPVHNENYSKFNVKAYFEEYNQLKLNMDYQWNERYRIISPEVNYYFKLGQDLTISLDYETDTRNPINNEDQKLEYFMETGTVKMKLDKDSWSYDLNLAQTQKDYPEDEPKNYTKNQLDQEFGWRIRPNLKLLLSYFEATACYPYDIKINNDYWKSETGIGGEYRFNDRWQVTGSFSNREEEKGLVPYLAKRDFEVKLKNKLAQDCTINFRVSSAEINYYSVIPYIDPDEFLFEEEDQKSRVENQAVLEWRSKLRKLNITVETGFYWLDKNYYSAQVEDFESKGLYASLHRNLGKIGLELEMAPDGTLWRRNGFYQLKLEYSF